MNATALALHSPRAVHDALLARGLDAARAATAAAGLGPWAIEIGELPAPLLLALVRQGDRLGLEVITGEDWAIVAGTLVRLSILARPGSAGRADRALPPGWDELTALVGGLLPPEPPGGWLTARGWLSLERPLILGVLNLTPDSFSDGGRFLAPEAALRQADILVAEGAAILDLGGESTRPGTEPVAEEEERRRVIPVIESLVRRHPTVPVSVDTVKSGVARAALEAGAAIVNDVSGLRLDLAIGGVVAAGGAGVILMHSRGSVSTMASLELAHYEPDVMRVVRGELGESLASALTAGLRPEQIVLDPGFGFAKTAEQNLLLCDRLAELLPLGRPLLVGPSRKRFLGSVTGREVGERDVATAAACVVAYERGARLFRVHNVAMTRDALAVASAVRGSR